MLKNTPKLLHSFWEPLKTSVRNYPYPEPFKQCLRNIPLTLTTKLCNGLTIATEERDTPHACVGLYIDGGSRYESESENGIAHFFEHMAFKGTCTRTKGVLADQMSCTGARFKCFTTREIVAYYAECLYDDVPVVTDILAECIFNNCLSPVEIEAQKKMVYLEMLKHDQDPNEILNDYLHAAAFNGTPLQQTVMGPTYNLYHYSDATITRYIEKAFNPTRVVLAAAGGITHDQMVHLAELYLSKLEPTKCVESDPYRFSGSDIRYRQDSLPCANVAVAFEAPCFCSDEKFIMEVAAEVVGGWDYTMHAGLNHAHRVARAGSVSQLCQAYKSFYIKYNDTGLWGAQFLAPLLGSDDILFNLQNEWMKLCTALTEPEVDRAKRETKTKLLTKTESVTGTCHDIGRWVLYNGYRPPLHDRIAAIEGVYSEDIKEMCMKYLYDRCPAVAAVGAIECVPDYIRIRSGQYWIRY